MNLSKIEIHNFQSHKKTVLNLSDGFNCIIGETESGKSAILKALDLVVHNRPLGYEDYVSYWCKDGDETRVAITTSDGLTVTRLRSKSKNQYLLSTLIKPLEGFGTGVPDEVKEVLNIHDINMQLQGFPYFLLNQSPPEVARYLNKLVNLEVIDTAFSNANKKVLSIKRDLNRENDELEALNKDLEEYKGLDEIDARLSYFDGLERDLEEENIQYEKLCDAEMDMINCHNKIAVLDGVLKHEERLNDLIDILGKRNELTKEYDRLFSVFEEMNELNLSLCGIKEILEHEERLNYLIKLLEERDDLEEKYTPLLSAFEEMECLQEVLYENDEVLKQEKKLNGLIDLNNKIADMDEEIDTYEKLLSSMIEDEKLINMKEKELKKLENEFHSKFPDVCPLCGKER